MRKETPEREVRVRVSTVLYKKFKMLCVERDLSLPKQIAELMRKFVEIDEENKRLMKNSNKD